MSEQYAPTKNIHNIPNYHTLKAWEGISHKKPWEFKVTAVVPVLDTVEELELVVQLLQLQSERPFIQVIDTGSTPENWARIEALRSDSVEVHRLTFAGVLNPSDFPAIAMDLALASCRTEYLFATHADCFLRRRDFIEHYLHLCNPQHPLVGYQLTPRRHKDWETMIGHTACFYHVPTCDQIGAGWNLRRCCRLHGVEDQRPDPVKRPGWPDTEFLINYLFKTAGYKAVIIGTEANWTRNIDENIDHVRSLTCGKLYNAQYYDKAKQWAEDAKSEARKRIIEWSRGEKYSVAIAIISHNYGQFLSQAIESAKNQAGVAEIVVIDDSSADNTKDIAEKHGVQYVRIESGNVNAARLAGLQATSSEIICFLDADDWLHEGYIESGRSYFADPQIAVVYSDFVYEGEMSGRSSFPEYKTGLIDRENFCHAGSLVRRSALVTAQPFHNAPDPKRAHCDWWMWRRVLQGNRKAVKQTGLYHYRWHASNHSHGMSPHSYYERAGLWQETITIVCPLSGRVDAWGQLSAWLDRQKHPHDLTKLILLDTSETPEYHSMILRWIQTTDYRDVRVIQKQVGSKDLASQNRYDPEVQRRVRQAMYRIYSVLDEVATEYVLTVEDDVLPIDSVADKLFRSMDHNVASVAAPYPSRFAKNWVAWDSTHRNVTNPRAGVAKTEGNGFGCTLLRKSVWDMWSVGSYLNLDDYDIAFYRWIRDHAQFVALVDWDIPAHHGIKQSETWQDKAKKFVRANMATVTL